MLEDSKKQNLKIDMVSSLPPQAGVSHYTAKVLQLLDQKKIKVRFWGFKSLYPPFLKQPLNDDSQLPKYTKKIKIKHPLSWWNFFSAILLPFRFKSKILYLQFWSPATVQFYLPIAIVTKLLGNKLVLVVHNASQHEKSWKIINSESFYAKGINFVVTSIINVATKLLINISDHHVLHNELSAKHFAEHYKIPQDKITIIDHPILEPYTRMNISKQEARANLHLPKEKTIILAFGNIRKYKGTEDIIEAFKKLDHKKYFLLIVGRVWGNEMKNELINLLADVPKPDYMLIEGFFPSADLESLFTATDVVILGHKDFYSASGVLNLAINYNTKVVATEIFQNEQGVDLVLKDISKLSDDNLQSILKKEVDKNQIKFEKDNNIADEHAKLILNIASQIENEETNTTFYNYFFNSVLLITSLLVSLITLNIFYLKPERVFFANAFVLIFFLLNSKYLSKVLSKILLHWYFFILVLYFATLYLSILPAIIIALLFAGIFGKILIIN